MVVDEWDLCLKAVLGMEMGFVFEAVLGMEMGFVFETVLEIGM